MLKGYFHCFRCTAKGSWYTFKNRLMQMYFGQSLNELVSAQVILLVWVCILKKLISTQVEINHRRVTNTRIKTPKN